MTNLLKDCSLACISPPYNKNTELWALVLLPASSDFFHICTHKLAWSQILIRLRHSECLLDEPAMSVMMSKLCSLCWYWKDGLWLRSSAARSEATYVKHWHFKLRNKPESSECRWMRKAQEMAQRLRVEEARGCQCVRCKTLRECTDWRNQTTRVTTNRKTTATFSESYVFVFAPFGISVCTHDATWVLTAVTFICYVSSSFM